MRTLAAAVVVYFSVITVAGANNTLFLPSDAFFFARLTSKEVDDLATQESPTLLYGNHWDGGRGCGVFGYSELKIVAMPEVEKTLLRKAFTLLQNNLDEKFISNGSEETRPAINIFVYNADYDWKRFGIALQYNENWPDETVASGVTHREHMVLESFILPEDGHVARLLERNWRDSKSVQKLDVQCAQRKDGSPNLSEPVEMRSKRSYIVLPNRKFSEYIYPKDGVHLCVISNEKIDHFVFEKQQWTAK